MQLSTHGVQPVAKGGYLRVVNGESSSRAGPYHKHLLDRHEFVFKWPSTETTPSNASHVPPNLTIQRCSPSWHSWAVKMCITKRELFAPASSPFTYARHRRLCGISQVQGSVHKKNPAASEEAYGFSKLQLIYATTSQRHLGQVFV